MSLLDLVKVFAALFKSLNVNSTYGHEFVCDICGGYCGKKCILQCPTCNNVDMYEGECSVCDSDSYW